MSDSNDESNIHNYGFYYYYVQGCIVIIERDGRATPCFIIWCFQFIGEAWFTVNATAEHLLSISLQWLLGHLL